jgi:16S rRNA (guanine527-N7)-methyltransferase
MSPPPAPLTAAEFQSETGISDATLSRFETYAALLRKWNRAINLVGKSTMDDIWRRHFLDSAQLMEYLPPRPDDRPLSIIDLGSGAGFPGLVLAILGAGEVHLVESDARKAAFMREVARATDTEVLFHVKRIEELAAESPDLRADVITARALAEFNQLMKYSGPFLRQNGVCLYLKGSTVDRELTGAKKQPKITLERFRSRSDPDGTILRIEVLEFDNSRS